jgi:cell wall-associated NlpC family hydrolase
MVVNKCSSFEDRLSLPQATLLLFDHGRRNSSRERGTAEEKGEMTAIIRIFACLLAGLLFAPAPASATHWQQPGQEEQPTPPPWEDEEDSEDDEEWDPPAFGVAPAPTPQPHPEPPVQVPQPQPQPQPGIPNPGGSDWDDDWDPPSRPEPEPQVPLVTTPTVAGKVAMLRTNGKAAIPRGAPKRVRAIIAAANQIAGKPYKWGGGHAKLVDRGYDCSGTVSYALIRSGTGLLASPLVSGAFARWGAAGDGKWISVYANKGHVYMEVAGLRLDTSTAGDWNGDKGVRWRPATGRRKGFKARHPVGL